MDSTRLRRAFRHDDDDDRDDDEPDVLDEEEQDALIQTLAEQNQRRNEQFRQGLLAVPALAAVPFLVAACSRSAATATAHSSPVLVSLLGLSSLVATAYLVHQQPPAVTGIPLLDAWSGAGAGAGRRDKGKGRATAGTLFGFRLPPALLSLLSSSPSSPLRRLLPLLNAGLCVMLMLSLLLPHRSSSSASASASLSYVLLGSLPAAVYAVVLVAKVTMAGVDPERELSRLRYEYKGA
ncbi:hypothetical protein SPI_05049 [Niveomyces insectorum RCEF 264]|uniref:Uncharacterized protein n=1 Tax=Niveomyces insectorum RCEF 264 TaxID=1081102 RepID=A0A167TWJ4_9HYPO|nr:hypothetical protein SPI_05049 [Niveomyces insectorum RCEF 264]